MDLNTLIGNEKMKDTINETILNNSVLNSYMFIGQEGVGKKIFAEEFARMILCMSDNKCNCNKCDSCIKFNSGNHPDFFEINPDGNYLKISQIREFQESVYQKPIVSNKKVFIINDADKMTVEAQNSLLKTLEEPPQYVVIILIVANESLMLSTVKSRCVKFNFYGILKNEMLDYIKSNKLIENPSENILELCGGSIGKLQNIKENIENYSQIENLFCNILSKKYKSILDITSNSKVLYKDKENINEYLEYMIVILYNLIKKEEIQISGKSIMYFNIIKMIENTKNKLNSNCNYDMCIDELLFNLEKEIS